MDQYQQYKRIADLIAGEIRGTLSSDEKENLHSWVGECEKNRLLYDRLRNSSYFHDWASAVEKIDAQAGLDRLYPQILRERKKEFRLTILKYAAVLLVPAFLAGAVYYFMPKPRPGKVLVTEQAPAIAPGKSKAILILNDGKTVNLDSGNDLQLKELDGTTIEKRDGQINYTPLDRQAPREPLFNVIRIPRGAEYHLILSDGTRVYLNAMSQFKYPVQFSKGARKVELSGEAFFEVTPSDVPFIVKTKGMDVKVLGTSFNVNAYEDNPQVVTTLVTGKVRLKAKNKLGGHYILSPQEQAVFNTTDLNWEVKTVDVRLYTGWKDGRFIFYDMRLEDIMNSLGRWYSADFAYSEPALKDLRFSGSLNKYEDLGQILDIIQSTNKVKVEINQTTIIFRET
ncbi:MAG: FecR domain-containing protein [Prolixibacteraceae bacterium]